MTEQELIDCPNGAEVESYVELDDRVSGWRWLYTDNRLNVYDENGVMTAKGAWDLVMRGPFHITMFPAPIELSECESWRRTKQNLKTRFDLLVRESYPLAYRSKKARGRRHERV